MKEPSGRIFFKEVKQKSKRYLNPPPKKIEREATQDVINEVVDKFIERGVWGELAIRFREGEIVGVEERLTHKIN